MKKLIPLIAAAFALPVIGAEPDPNPNRFQSDSIDKPVLAAPRHPTAEQPRTDERNATRERTDGEPPAGDTKPGGPSAAVRDPREPKAASPSEPGSAMGSTRGRSLSD
ncbi:MAG TPA: hypothetical protein VEA41_02770 [Salinarimonas sp.]|nr:hypothetical protein [Salinarimonas sp.]